MAFITLTRVTPHTDGFGGTQEKVIHINTDLILSVEEAYPTIISSPTGQTIRVKESVFLVSQLIRDANTPNAG